MPLKANKSVSAQSLVETSGYGGWLQKRGAGGPTKGFQPRYCIAHNGYFYYFKDHNGKSAKGVFCLAGYSASEGPPDKANKWTFMITATGINKARRYYFAAGSPKEREGWITSVNEDIAKVWPTSSVRGVGDGQNEDDISDDSDPEPYDYTQYKPDDVSFSNPENVAFDKKLPRDVATSQFKGGNKFFGPRISERDDLQGLPKASVPEPPPRKDKPKMLTVQKQEKGNGGYEVITPFAKHPYLPTGNEKTEKENLQNSHEDEDYEKMSAANVSSSYVQRDVAGSSLDSSRTDLQLPPKNPIPKPRNDRRSVGEIPSAAIASMDITDGFYQDPQGDEADDDATILPNSVYQWHLNRENSEMLLSNIGAVGLYLIRSGKEGKHVLCVYTIEGVCRHYIIFQKEGMQFLRQEPEPKFLKLGDLIRYYMKNNLPTCNVKLSKPYRS